MVNIPRRRAKRNAEPRAPRVIATSLPIEIMDNIFAQITFDSPLPRRSKVYSNLSVVADNWCEPARGILVRDVVIQDWQKLSETMPEWAGALIRTFTMDVSVFEWQKWNGSGKAARRLFKLISNMPNLRSLELRELPFSRFDHRDVSYMRSTLLLLSLTHLRLDNESASMRWMLADLLATSGNVSSLKYFDDTDGSFTTEEVDGFGMFDDLGDDLCGEERFEFGGDSDGSSGSDDDASATAHPSPPEARIDFGGKMRKLDASSEYVESTFCEQMRSMRGLAGLVELDIGSGFLEAEKVEELFRVIGPTLAKVRIDALVGAISPHLSLLRTLTHLRFSMIAPDYPAVVALPPSLSSLYFFSDTNLLPVLQGWTAQPSLLPSTLQHLDISYIASPSTFENLPRSILFTTEPQSRGNLQSYLATASPGSVRFRALEIERKISDETRDSLVSECKRLGIEFKCTT